MPRSSRCPQWHLADVVSTGNAGGIRRGSLLNFFERLAQKKRTTTETLSYTEKLHGGTEELRKALCGIASVLSVSSVVKAFLN
jgi:hypothetical protein